MKNTKKTAFSLMEMSLVLIVVGIIVAGVANGSKLVMAYKVNVAKSVTESSSIPGIADLVFWIETTSDKGFTSKIDEGSAVTAWYDLSPSNSSKVNLFQATTANAPIYANKGIGDLPSVQFDGVDDALNGTGLNLSANNTVFAVFNADVGSSAGVRDLLTTFYDFDTNFTNANSLNGTLIEFTVTAALLRNLYRSPVGGGGGDSNFSATAIVENKNYILTSVRDFQAASLKNWLNNELVIGGAAAVTGGDFNLPVSNITVGNLNDTFARPFKGKISEIIIYNRALNQEEIDEVEAYLSKKYNIKI